MGPWRWALVTAWVALVVAAALPRRPRRAPALDLVGVDGRAGLPGVGRPLRALGGALRRVATRRRDPTPRPGDAALGLGVLGGLLLLVVSPPLAPASVALALLAARVGARRAEESRRRAASDALPDVVDLVALGVGSGLGVGAALALVAPHVGPPLAPALAEVDVRLRHGAPLADALAPVVAATPAARPLATLLRAAHADGAPVVEALARLADEMRLDRRRAVEARTRQVPVRLLFPLVLCTLPAFVLLTIVPPIVAALGDLRT